MPQGAPRLSLRLQVALLLALVLLAHLSLLRGEYVQDDELAIERNAIVARGALDEILGSSYWEGARGADRTLYRPTAIASYALERKLTGAPSAPLSRGINVALHAAVTLALLGLARRLGWNPFGAFAAAALFAAHPVHVEAIANVVGRAEILAALFTLAALAALTASGAWHERPAGTPRLAAWTAAALLLLALGAKEVAFAAPALMLLLEILLRPPLAGRDRRFFIDRAAALAPSLLALVVYGIARVRALGAIAALQPVHPLDNPLVDAHGVERLATALGLVARYARLLVFPNRLSLDYSGAVIGLEPGFSRPLPLVGLALLALVVGWLALPLVSARFGTEAARRRAFAAGFLLLPYLVVGNLLFDVGAIFAERFVYLPSVGFCLLAGLGFAALARRPAYVGPLFALLGVLVVISAVGTFRRGLEWRDNTTVFTAAARVVPKSPRAHFALGKLAVERNEPRAALEHLDRALAAAPEHPTAWLEKGNAYAALGRWADAEAAFRRTLKRVPTYATAHRNLALALRRQGRVGEAEAELRKALIWDPDSATGWAELGNLCLSERRFAEAAEAYRRAMALGRRDLAERLRIAERGIAGAE